MHAPRKATDSTKSTMRKGTRSCELGVSHWEARGQLEEVLHQLTDDLAKTLAAVSALAGAWSTMTKKI